MKMSTIIEAVEFWLRKSKLKIEAVTRPVLDEVLSNREIFTDEPSGLVNRIRDQFIWQDVE